MITNQPKTVITYPDRNRYDDWEKDLQDDDKAQAFLIKLSGPDLEIVNNINSTSEDDAIRISGQELIDAASKLASNVVGFDQMGFGRLAKNNAEFKLIYDAFMMAYKLKF